MAFFPGLGGGKSLNLDVDGGIYGGAGAGVPAAPAFGLGGPAGGGLGGIPFGGGWGGVPYIPVTPLGALGGFKGDLLLPIVAIGGGLFILVLIFLAVKAALAWKVGLLAGKKAPRDTTFAGGPPQEDQLNQLASMVLSAIQSQTCAQNMICQVGSYARSQQGLPSLLRILEAIVPSSMQEPLVILRSSAEGSFNCDEKYKCAPSGSAKMDNKPAAAQDNASTNKIN